MPWPPGLGRQVNASRSSRVIYRQKPRGISENPSPPLAWDILNGRAPASAPLVSLQLQQGFWVGTRSDGSYDSIHSEDIKALLRAHKARKELP